MISTKYTCFIDSICTPKSHALPPTQVFFRHKGVDGEEQKSCTVGIETNTAIRKGEQILVDYGSSFWRQTVELDDADPPDVHSLSVCVLCVIVYYIVYTDL